MHKHKSIYSKLYVPLSRRAKFTPRVGRPHRPKMIAWHGPDAFFKNRFYELDSWYKARIQRPEILPKMHIIDPDLFMESYEQKMIRQKPRTLNIGFSKSKEPVMKKTAEEKANIEKKAISNELIIDLNQVDSSNQLELSEHFNIFEDLFSPGVYFHNTQPLDICWESGEGSSKLMEFVHFGNILRAENAQKRPSVRIGKIGGSSAAFNTLLMVNLEGPGREEIATNQSNKSPFNDRMSKCGGKGKAGKPSTDLGVQDAETEMLERIERTQLVHWMVANIQDSEQGILEGGEEVIPYLQPIPFMGTGYHRFVFLLLRHRKMLDFSAFKTENSKNPDSLLQRAFNVNSFYKAHEEEMTPSAIKFCQIKWDQSCDRAMHEIGLKSPKYWYEWNEPLKPEQKEFPKKSMPFNHYLDLFRNPSTMRQEVQKRRLEMLVKMKPEEQILRPQKYPDIFYAENRRKLPEFVHQRRMAENIGEGIFSALYHPYENPAEQHEMEKWRIDGDGEEEKKQMKAT